MFGNGGWDYFGVMSMISGWVIGFIFFLIWLAVVLLFVRFLLIGTRAAKSYLRSRGEHDGLLPRNNAPAAPAAPAATTTAAPRTPKK